MSRSRQPETPPPEELCPEDRKRLKAWAKNHKNPAVRALYREGMILNLAERCLIHFNEKYNKKGEMRSDWLGTCRNWILKHLEFKAERQQKERPQVDLDRREGNVTHIADVLRGKE